MSGIHAERLIRAFGRLGWRFHRRGRHQCVLTDGNGRIVVVSIHKGRTLKEGTARAILQQAGVDEETFFANY
jgi:predicted RNA binding protein YcfA (HicA-like mRNA interferase family)